MSLEVTRPAPEGDRPTVNPDAAKQSDASSIPSAADIAWRREAYAVIEILGRTGVKFSADDIAALAGNPPRCGRQMSAAFGVMRRRKIIQSVGAQIGREGGLMRIWIGAQR